MYGPPRRGPPGGLHPPGDRHDLPFEAPRRIVAPTRRPLALTDATGHAALQGRSVDNPIVDFAVLPLDASWWGVDAVVCAKGEIEGAIAAPGFASYTAVRPGGAHRGAREPAPPGAISNGVARALSFLLPRRYRVVSAERVAKTLLAAALEAPPGHHVIPSEAIAA